MKKILPVAMLVLTVMICLLSACQNRTVQESAPYNTSETVQRREDMDSTSENSAEEIPSITQSAETPAEEEIPEPNSHDKASAEAPPENPMPSVIDYYFMGSQYGMGDNPSFSSLFDAPDGLSRLKEFYAELNKAVNRVEYHLQSLEYVGTYAGDVKFSASGSVNGLGDDNNYHTSLKTLMVGRSIYDAFDDVIEVGCNFQEEDFTVEAVTDVIPIILGYDYMGIYDVGDELLLSLHTQPLTFQVIGFLQKNAVLHFNRDIPLDQHIIVPFYDIAYEPTDAVNEYYQERYYSQKCEGFVSMDASADAEQMFQNVRELAEEYDLLFAVTPAKVNVSEKLNIQCNS